MTKGGAMLKRLLNDKFLQAVTDKITQAVNETLSSYHQQSEAKMDTILDHVESLRLEVKSLDQRLSTKEIKDRSEYGHVTYKLNSLQNEVLDKKKKKSEDKKSIN